MNTKLSNIIEQLTNIYYTQEWWQKNKLPFEEAVKYHARLFEKGRIIVYEEEGKVLGYVESWRINYEQFGRIICHNGFSAYLENVNDGNICYVANCWIHPEWRGGNVYKALRLKFFQQNHTCDYFVGEALRKKTQPVKVFKRTDISMRFRLGG